MPNLADAPSAFIIRLHVWQTSNAIPHERLLAGSQHRMQVYGTACRQSWTPSDVVCPALHQGTRGWLNFRPAEDQRVSVAATLDAPNSKGLQGTGKYD